MSVSELTAIIAGLLAFLLGAGTFFFGRRAAAHWSFIAGMLVLGTEAICSSLALGALSSPQLIFWNRWKLMASALVPGTWLIFSLTCGRGNSAEFLKKWRPVWLLFLVGPPLAVVLSSHALIQNLETTAPGGPWFVQLGWLGRGLALTLIIVSILVLMNLERTFRAAVGTQRWRIKYLALGIGLLFGVRVYTASQALMFWGYSASLVLLESMALILACVCVGYSLLRSKAAGVEVYPSRAVLQYSVTGIVAGVYLLVIGVFFEVVTALGDHTAFQLKSFLILVGIVGLAVVLSVGPSATAGVGIHRASFPSPIL